MATNTERFISNVTLINNFLLMKAREKYEPEKSERRHVLGSKCRKKPDGRKRRKSKSKYILTVVLLMPKILLRTRIKLNVLPTKL